MNIKPPHIRSSRTKRSAHALHSSSESRIQNPKSILLGDFAALIFSGSIADLGELPGEPTALALYKFALPDPRLDASQDFARALGMPLPIWPADRVRPIDGVCFVLADAQHPAIEALRDGGGIEGEHFVIATELNARDVHAKLDDELRRFVESLSPKGSVAILGYGHQGAAIAQRLRSFFRIKEDRIVIHDSNPDSQQRAASDGFRMIDEPQVLREVGGVIYSPLMRHERLFNLLVSAQGRGVTVLDNSHRAGDREQFHRRQNIFFDCAADGALILDHDQIKVKPHGLAMNCAIIRQERRCLAGVELPHLHGPHRFALHRIDSAVDLAQPAPTDPLTRATWIGLERAFVSLRDRADLGYFAARDLCSRLWPDATSAVFPSMHTADLGATALERLLLGHLDGREVASTMQTPAQRVTLAIAAAHYAAQRPIIEIGSAFGGSAMVMAAATNVHRPPIYSIDPETSTRDIMRFAFEREGQLDRLHQLIQTSDQAIDKLADMHSKAGLVFIDGLHTYTGVKADFEAYAPLVAPGGALVFHDVAPQIFSVFRFVLERVLADPRFHARCLVDGLLILERRQ